MNILYFGLGVRGHATLAQLVSLHETIKAVVIPPHARPDKTDQIQFICKKNSIPVIESAPKARTWKRVETICFDSIVVNSYPYLLPESLISRAAGMTLNFHPSLLPRYRGAHVINWVLINDEKKTGTTLHTLGKNFDNGDIYVQEEIRIEDNDTALTLRQKIIDVEKILLGKYWQALKNKELKPKKQNEEQSNYCAARKPDDGKIDWSWSDRRIYNFIRALCPPWPGAFTYFEDKKIIFHTAHLEKEKLVIDEYEACDEKQKQSIVIREDFLKKYGRPQNATK